MRTGVVLLLVVALPAALPASLAAQDAASILQKMQEKELERWRRVDNYVVDQTTLGNRMLFYYEKFQVTTADGNVRPAFRMVMPDEIARRQGEEQSGPGFSAEEMQALEQAAEPGGRLSGSKAEQELEQAGLPSQLLRSADPNHLAALGISNLAAGAVAANDDREQKDEARESIDAMADFAARARFEGIEQVDGREAFILKTEDIGRTRDMDGSGELTMHSATLWVDAQEYVTLKSELHGTATHEGESQPIVIEKQDQDYRQVGSLYMPFRQVVRIAGVMSAEQEAQMREAQQQMAELEEKLAEMPESQRRLMLDTMAPQLEMMQDMASGRGISLVTEVREVRVNAGLPDELALGYGSPPGGQPTGYSQTAPSPAMPAATASPATAPLEGAALREAQQACLQEKVTTTQEAQKKRRGLGRLVGAVARVASRIGNSELSRAAGDAFAAKATADDLAAAAKDLGLTEDDVAACRNPT